MSGWSRTAASSGAVLGICLGLLLLFYGLVSPTLTLWLITVVFLAIVLALIFWVPVRLIERRRPPSPPPTEWKGPGAPSPPSVPPEGSP
jgi:high-affinity Fe2+/Pb2+ permease